MGWSANTISFGVMAPNSSKLKRQYSPSRSPRYALLTTYEPLSPAAEGSPCSAFLRTLATSPTSRQPMPPQGPPPALPTSVPFSASMR